MATIDDLQKDIRGLVGNVKLLADDLKGLRLYLADNMASKQDLRDLGERFEEKFATKGEVRRYATLVEKTLAKFQKVEDEQLSHRVEHDDINADIKAIKAVPVIAHQLKKRS